MRNVFRYQYLLSVYFLCLPFQLFGSASLSKYSLSFDHYSIEQGLVHNSINCIVQDKKGFLWLGSNGGLQRFDGYSFVKYKPHGGKPNALKGMAIWALFVDKNDDLWVGSLDGGLSKYNRNNDNFTTYLHRTNDIESISSNDVVKIFEDTYRNFWIATRGGGLNLLNRETGKFTSFRHEEGNENSLSSNIIHDYAIDCNGQIWLATEVGISILNPATRKFRRYYKKVGDLNSIKSIPILSLAFSTNEELWIGTWQNGAYKFDLHANSIRNYFSVEQIPESLGGNTVWCFFKDSFGNIWAGTDRGLNLYRRETDNFSRYESDPNNPKSLTDNFVRFLYEDSGGVLWIGTNNGGLNKVDLYSKRFQATSYNKYNSKGISCASVTAICKDYEGKVWLGTCNGLNEYNEKNGTYRKFLIDPEKKSVVNTDDINWMVAGAPPYLYIATDLGFNQFNYTNNTFVSYRSIPGNKNSLSNNGIYTLAYESSGVLWIGSWGGGLDRFDTKTGDFRNIPIDSANKARNVVLCILDDKKGNLYLGTYSHGLVKLNKSTGAMTYYEANPDDPNQLKGNVVLFLHQRNEDEIWVCTGGGGLSVFSPQSEIFRNFDLEDGLPSSDLKAILEDSHHNLWISSGKGISKLTIQKDSISDIPTYRFTNFDLKDGLQDNVFNPGACMKDSNGIMYFGGINGVNKFMPDSIVSNRFLPNIVITDFQVLNKSVGIGEKINGRVLLGQSITETSEIVLTYREYVISIEFTALHFSSPEKNRYKYKLEGFDEEWIDIDASRRFVTYSNLDAGKYEFRVKATNNDGIWSNSEALLKLIVLPPYWQTWWFRILAILFFGFFIASFFLVRLNSMKIKESFLKQKISERTLALTESNIALKERQEEITLQNEELASHRSHLEKLVTERTRELGKALRKAEESDRLKTAFLANMSHEIRTPMNAIVGFSSLLREFTHTDEEKKQFIDIIGQNCDSLLVLINDILDISKIEANQVDVFPGLFSASKVLEDLERFFIMKENGRIDIQYVKPFEEIVLMNDEIRFRQIVINLINNARKFTESGYVRFGCEIGGPNIRFYVTDTGMGIAESDIERIFNPFTKGEYGHSRVYRGAGLGLAISKHLVEKMGGTIWFESVVDKGTTFHFTLPYMAGLKLETKPDKVFLPRGMVDFSHAHILIAEDESANYLYLERVLKPTRANLYWAKDGLEAVQLVRDSSLNRFDLILMDIKLPVMNGVDAFIEIQKIDRKIPVIAQTAFAQEVDRHQALEIGFSDYLTKPIRPEELIRVMQKYLDDNVDKG